MSSHHAARASPFGAMLQPSSSVLRRVAVAVAVDAAVEVLRGVAVGVDTTAVDVVVGIAVRVDTTAVDVAVGCVVLVAEGCTVMVTVGGAVADGLTIAQKR